MGKIKESLNMLTKTEAAELVSEKLQRMSPSENPYVVVEEYTIERPFGWVFFYNSKKFLDTGIFRDRLVGNGPVFVNKDSGRMEFYGSGKPTEELIKDYEKRLAEMEADSRKPKFQDSLDERETTR